MKTRLFIIIFLCNALNLYSQYPECPEDGTYPFCLDTVWKDTTIFWELPYSDGKCAASITISYRDCDEWSGLPGKQIRIDSICYFYLDSIRDCVFFEYRDSSGTYPYKLILDRSIYRQINQYLALMARILFRDNIDSTNYEIAIIQNMCRQNIPRFDDNEVLNWSCNQWVYPCCIIKYKIQWVFKHPRWFYKISHSINESTGALTHKCDTTLTYLCENPCRDLIFTNFEIEVPYPYSPPDSLLSGNPNINDFEQDIKINYDYHNDKVYIIFDKWIEYEDINLEIFNIFGQAILKIDKDDIKMKKNIEINLGHLPQNVYIILLRHRNNVKTKKIISLIK